MNEATEQFAEFTRRGHQLFGAAVQAWEQATRSMADAADRADRRLPDLGASIDAAFDFAAQMLAEQRDFTRALMAVTVQVMTPTADRPATDTGPVPAPAAGSNGRAAADQPPPAADEPRPLPDEPATEPAAAQATPGTAPETATAETVTPAKQTTAKKTTAKKTAAKKTTTARPAPAKRATASASARDPAKAPAKRANRAKRTPPPGDTG